MIEPPKAKKDGHTNEKAPAVPRYNHNHRHRRPSNYHRRATAANINGLPHDATTQLCFSFIRVATVQFCFSFSNVTGHQHRPTLSIVGDPSSSSFATKRKEQEGTRLRQMNFNQSKKQQAPIVQYLSIIHRLSVGRFFLSSATTSFSSICSEMDGDC
uniref:Uncharacterized protein n=1 Tax=Salix viminalis TaxID=40686 RepID=A0A6N2KBA9_SALVM